MNAYNVTSGTATSGNTEPLVTSPLYFVRGGRVHQATSILFSGAGNNGYYWSSTPRSGSNAYYLIFDATYTIDPSATSGRQNGYSVRCIAR